MLGSSAAEGILLALPGETSAMPPTSRVRNRVVVVCAVFLLAVAVVACVYRGEIRAFRYRNVTEVRVVEDSDWFDYPVGPPNARGYYRAQKFGEDRHLGEDWNGRGGGNSDFGDRVYSVADGTVAFARHCDLGWGNVVRMAHPVTGEEVVEAVYGHLDAIRVKEGDSVRRGQVIGTIGNADGRYPAHLHFEIRREVGLPLGSGYGDDPDGLFLDPTGFIDKHRKRPRS
jgi:murein DD-endopeptidase MepM/ murein hydrolase activator NlpD